MRLLIVDDDSNKIESISRVVRDVLPQAEIAEARSYQSGLRHLVQQGADIVLLDMSMPTFDQTYAESGGRLRPFAGWDILREMKRRRLRSKVIVVTQFESFGEGPDVMTLGQLEKRLRVEYAQYYVAAVFYQPSTSEWRARLGALLADAQAKANT